MKQYKSEFLLILNYFNQTPPKPHPFVCYPKNSEVYLPLITLAESLTSGVATYIANTSLSSLDINWWTISIKLLGITYILMPNLDCLFIYDSANSISSVADMAQNPNLFSEVSQESTSYNVKSDLLGSEKSSILVHDSYDDKEPFDKKNGFLYDVNNYIIYIIRQVLWELDNMWNFLSVLRSQFFRAGDAELWSFVQNLDLRDIMPFTHLAMGEYSELFDYDIELYFRLIDIIYDFNNVDSLESANVLWFDIYEEMNYLMQLAESIQRGFISNLVERVTNRFEFPNRYNRAVTLFGFSNSGLHNMDFGSLDGEWLLLAEWGELDPDLEMWFLMSIANVLLPYLYLILSTL